MTTADVRAVAVLGLGAMGSRMARNLASAGHRVTVWNRTGAVAHDLAGEIGASVGESPSVAVESADVVLTVVRDDVASSELWLGDDGLFATLAATGRDAVAVEQSTISPEHARRLAAAAADAGVRFVEAPVVGSRPQADAGALVHLVGGDGAVLDVVRTVLEVNAGAIRRVGEAGAAATLKLAINGLFAVQVAAYAEIVGLLERSAVDGGEAIDVLSSLPITSPGLQRILGLVAARDFTPNFPVHLVAKDLGYLSGLGRELDTALPMSDAAAAVFAEGASAAQADLDIAGIADRYI